MPPLPHSWDLTPSEAVAVQKDLRSRVRLEPLRREIKTIAGADISYNKYSEVLYAGIVVLGLPDLQIVESVGVRSISRFPYVPGLLSFREIPPLLEAWEKLQTKPDVLVLDGQGIAHPRRMGVASHIGVLLDWPTIGCAKSILIGKHGELAPEAGSRSPLVDRGEQIGFALRTRKNVTPVYVSPGHLTDLDSAAELMLRAVTKYRLPEPTRQAHLLVNEIRRADK
ncbi:MAG TPA: deoxyribonuclease V [Blastocatellia bacterium]|nr:deoxyribonuclease V [Blastocatellia bacterium]HMV87397.1 deoxyribonuclease V [Blastocatellia bacterium]HMX27148.1 deoxyribonuclease V [Blastocatellia bacterium]HMY73027.1 deoxyribonuclease V [Blastocatellia bacterium]HMZ16632.1 deoxyribonuclease V [Blastocatellia bacterium]